MFYVSPLWAVGIHISFLVTGVLGNLFILVVHFQDWLKTHDFNPAMTIINSIALINIIFQGTIAFNEVSGYMFEEFYEQVWVVNPLVVIMTSLAFSSLWCSTCLCFYYCIKIVNFNGSFFYKVKTKVPLFVPWFLIISITASWSLGIPAYWDLYTDYEPVTTFTATNVTLTFYYCLKSRCQCLFQIYMIFAAVAFSIILITAGAIVTSLCKHMIRLKKNNGGSGNSRLQSHLSAVKTVTSLLLLYLMFYGFLSLIFFEVRDAGSFLLTFSFFVVSSLPTFNSIILIMGNRKLSNNLKKLLVMRPLDVNTEITVTAN